MCAHNTKSPAKKRKKKSSIAIEFVCLEIIKTENSLPKYANKEMINWLQWFDG